ncbi:MAG: hypothetical protein ACLFWF_07475 [Alphaproteobacteria bacterium]
MRINTSEREAHVNKLQDWLGTVPARCALFLYLSVGLFQLLIIPSGFEAWMGIHWIEGLICAAVVAWIPILGQGLGLAAAMTEMNWPAPLAAGVFLWPVWLFGSVYLARRFGGGRNRKRDRDGRDLFGRGLPASGSGDAPSGARTARFF